MFSLLFISTLLAGIVFPSVFPDEARVETLHRSMQAFATERKLTTIQITDTVSLRTAVIAWCDNEATATTTYGHISTWDTSGVTDMSYLFGASCFSSHCTVYYCSSYSTFNSDISGWDGKCRCCLLTAHDESKLFYCRLTYVCRLLCVGCIIESSP